ncbi:protein of unknown function [Candidatus Filomicrobium marinum]|uniref:Uncharacterized protein n=1 Tax=Candidatus Filomicrobium marinum TaxID=1608628 RepID=A0A0D6JCI8_9HYPH|nr:protein of unknown function [Candidatus Filomicrobium marinum]CPR16507.1 protein of unknown function [Candidatus Filomicrobium marinum]
MGLDRWCGNTLTVLGPGFFEVRTVRTFLEQLMSHLLSARYCRPFLLFSRAGNERVNALQSGDAAAGWHLN